MKLLSLWFQEKCLLLLSEFITFFAFILFLTQNTFKFGLVITYLFFEFLLFVLSYILALLLLCFQISYSFLKIVHLFYQSILLVTKLQILIFSFLYYTQFTWMLVSVYFFILWYFWLESTIFFTNGSCVRLITPHKLLPSLCCCFYFSSFTSIVMKWICLRRFSIYSSSILRLGLSPKAYATLFYLETPS